MDLPDRLKPFILQTKLNIIQDIPVLTEQIRMTAQEFFAPGFAKGASIGAVIILLLTLFSCSRSKEVTVPDGLVVRGPDGSIEVVDHGHRKHIPDPQTFYNLGYVDKDVNEITQEQYDGLPPGSWFPHLDSRLVSSPGQIYFVERGRRRHVPDTETLKSLCLGPAVQSLPPEMIQSIPEGEPLPHNSSVCSQAKPAK